MQRSHLGKCDSTGCPHQPTCVRRPPPFKEAPAILRKPGKRSLGPRKGPAGTEGGGVGAGLQLEDQGVVLSGTKVLTPQRRGMYTKHFCKVGFYR